MRMLTKYGDYIFNGHYEDVRDLVTPVDVTPCAKWIYNGDKSYDIVNDLSIIIPPWPITWIEYSPQVGLDRIGVLCSAFRWDEFKQEGGSIPYRLKRIYNVKNLEWVVWYKIYVSEFSTPISVARIWHGLNKEGKADTSKGVVKTTDEFEKYGSATSSKEDAKKITSLFEPIELGISLCHANNVDIYEDHVPDAVQKKRRKSGKNPGKTFKCLDIEPMKKKSQRKSKKGESDVERALHICRGHFKTYTEENPLFGEHTGTYWYPMHVRGSTDAGEVEKSYRVNQPQ